MMDAIKNTIHSLFPIAGILEPNCVTVPRISGVSKIADAVVITASLLTKSANFPILIVGAKLLINILKDIVNNTLDVEPLAVCS